ncbi:hypothetical protein CHS0354_039036 [Potamilus streckersoni]|uniref:Uncharacterized protein n=1 Tax=Potamilus streckersoni TaxID=2493646 RepID=A0AAE0RRL8_9BIVA|nr:hypothetical protein CHS0354_039036 [Potamilus streckersoni]
MKSDKKWKSIIAEQDFVDDISLLSCQHQHIKQNTEVLAENASSSISLNVDIDKTKLLKESTNGVSVEWRRALESVPLPFQMENSKKMLEWRPLHHK